MVLRIEETEAVGARAILEVHTSLLEEQEVLLSLHLIAGV
jgi:hypothetical protein